MREATALTPGGGALRPCRKAPLSQWERGWGEGLGSSCLLGPTQVGHTQGVLASNPAREVKTERSQRNEGKTPALTAEEMHQLLESFDTDLYPRLTRLFEIQHVESGEPVQKERDLRGLVREFVTP